MHFLSNPLMLSHGKTSLYHHNSHPIVTLQLKILHRDFCVWARPHSFSLFTSLCQPLAEFSNLYSSLTLCYRCKLWFNSFLSHVQRALGFGLSGYWWDNESIFCSYITTISQKAAAAPVVRDVFTHWVYSVSDCSAEDCRWGPPGLFWRSSHQLRLTGKEREQ